MYILFIHYKPRSLLKISKIVELVFSKVHCCVREDGLQMFMKILRSDSLQSKQLLLMG